MTKLACPAQLAGQARISSGLQAAHLPKERQEQQGEHPRRQKGDSDMGRFPDHPFRRYEPGKYRQAQDRMGAEFLGDPAHRLPPLLRITGLLPERAAPVEQICPIVDGGKPHSLRKAGVGEGQGRKLCYLEVDKDTENHLQAPRSRQFRDTFFRL